MSMQGFLYSFLAIGTFILDRFTKWYALHHWISEYFVAPFLSFRLTINRGISWGFFNDAHSGIFVVITLLIIAVTAVLCVYAYGRMRMGYFILGEVLVMSGSVSNILDRLLYAGVIDFVVVHNGNFVWPIFNGADSLIVGGVIIMVIQMVFSHEYA